MISGAKGIMYEMTRASVEIAKTHRQRLQPTS